MRRPLGPLLVTLAACRPGARSAPADAARPRAEVRAAPRSACDEVLAEGRRALDAWRQRQRGPVAAEAWADLATFNQCVEADERLWATVLGAPMGDPRAATLAGRFKLVYVGRDGTRSEAWPAVADAGQSFTLRAQETSWRHGEEGASRLAPVARFDFDGDGAPELLARVVERAGDALPTERVLVWRATATRLEPFEPAMGLHPVGVEDFDGDGRPDLRTHAELLGVDDARPGATLRGPALVARSLRGGLFALSSGAALARNRERCPAPPAPPLLVRAGAALDAQASAARVACAMLWRAPPAAVEAQLRRECPARPGVAAPCAEALPGLVAMTRVTPLADLRAAASFEASGGGEDGGAARTWRAVLEGVPGVAPLALGSLAGECDAVDGEGRGGEVASLRCWSGADGVEVRAVRQGAALVWQRRALRDGGSPTVFTELRRVALPLGLALRAGAVVEAE